MALLSAKNIVKIAELKIMAAILGAYICNKKKIGLNLGIEFFILSLGYDCNLGHSNGFWFGILCRGFE